MSDPTWCFPHGNCTKTMHCWSGLCAYDTVTCEPYCYTKVISDTAFWVIFGGIGGLFACLFACVVVCNRQARRAIRSREHIVQMERIAEANAAPAKTVMPSTNPNVVV